MNCQCSNHMLHCRKIDRLLVSNLSSRQHSTIIRISSYPNHSSSDHKNICVNSKKFILFRNNYSPHILSESYNNAIGIRYFHLSNGLFAPEPNKPSSKVEETVEVLKEKAKAKDSGPPVAVSQTETAVVKKSLKQKVVDEIVHYYHGFRLLFIDIKVSSFLVWRILNGKTLTRREHNLVSNKN